MLTLFGFRIIVLFRKFLKAYYHTLIPEKRKTCRSFIVLYPFVRFSGSSAYHYGDHLGFNLILTPKVDLVQDVWLPLRVVARSRRSYGKIKVREQSRRAEKLVLKAHSHRGVNFIERSLHEKLDLLTFAHEQI